MKAWFDFACAIGAGFVSPAAGAGADVAAGVTGLVASPSSLVNLAIRLLKPCCSSHGSSTLGSGACLSKESGSAGGGTSSRSCTSFLETRISSAFCSSDSRRLGCLISLVRASSVSRSPYSLISSAAVLMPMPGAPGTLSVESPASAWTSTTFSGATPNFSITSAGPILRIFIGSIISTPGRTSCIRSLSDDTMVQVAPASTAMRA